MMPDSVLGVRRLAGRWLGVRWLGVRRKLGVRRRLGIRENWLAPLVVAATVTLTGCSASSPSSSPYRAKAPAGTSVATSANAGSGSSSAAPLPIGAADATAPAPAVLSSSSLPVHLSVPAIGVATSLEALQLLPGGAMQSPTQWQEAGWFSAGVIPGDAGPAVIAGHVDSRKGPAVFFKLRKLKVGDTAQVLQANGSTLNFTVDSVQEYPKDDFPTSAVYGPTALPVLRLVTCTGDFDYKAHSYLDNLVVTLHLDGLFDQ